MLNFQCVLAAKVAKTVGYSWKTYTYAYIYSKLPNPQTDWRAKIGSGNTFDVNKTFGFFFSGI